MKYVACIGHFDGVHLGHQKLINKTIELASDDYISSAITFFPDPKTVYGSDKNRKHLSSLKQKEEYLYQLGIQEVIVIDFTKEFSLVTPDIFIEYFLNHFDLKTLVCGPDFSFGHKGCGKVNDLINSSIRNFDVVTVQEQLYKGHKINSTEIIEMIKNGDIDQANYLLNKRYVANVNIKNKMIVDSENVLPLSGDYQVEINQKTYLLSDNHLDYKNGNVDISFIGNSMIE
ncbi:MAG: hypothetical protein ACI4WG_00060 [Erysipelotrichaceae bacterium]